MKTYSELKELKTFLERFDYLKLEGEVAKETFGYDRVLNQSLYSSKEWKDVRKRVIMRDLGCDLGIEGYEINDRPIIHHMNPISKEDIINRNPDIFNDEFLITVTHNTHNALHYGDFNLVDKDPIERKPNDTRLW